MAIEGFDYKAFAENLASQASELVPAEFKNFEKEYVSKTLLNFSLLAGEALYNDEALKFTSEQAMLLTQIIAEWSFHKSCDLVRSGILPEYWDAVLQKIAFTIFEIGKQTISQNLPQDEILQLIEHHVKKAYNEALEELAQKGIINEELKESAEKQSNIDAMMEQLKEEQAQEDAQKAAQKDAPQVQADAKNAKNTQNSKILKLASVALILRRLSSDKVQTILTKFNPQDAQTVIQYMQMEDLESKVDKSIALKCLKEIKTTLPETKFVSPNKIMKKLKEAFEKKDKVKLEKMLRKERPNVRKFIFSAWEGEYYELPSKVANIIAQHIEDSV